MTENTEYTLHLTTQSLQNVVSERVVSLNFRTDPPYKSATTRIYVTRLSTLEKVIYACKLTAGVSEAMIRATGINPDDIFGKGRSL